MGDLVLDLGWGPKKVSKDRFTHGPRAMTLKVQSPLKIMQRSYRGKKKSKLVLTGPQAQCKLKVDHVEGLQHILWQIQNNR